MGNEWARILVVDDSRSMLEVLDRNLKSAGYGVVTAPGVAEAVRILEGARIDLVITDLKMPKVGGLDLIRHVHENFKDAGIITITGYASIESAVTAVKEGAEYYLPKPFTDAELLDAVGRTLEKVQLRSIARPGDEETPVPHFGLIGNSEAMCSVFRSVAKAASTTATVLLTGESGTGKELVARAIHYSGPRAAAPFVPVNCAGIPEGLVESELFGHVKGAFTGAVTTRAGFFLTAHGGTIFLDEIAELPPPTQAKLLRVLEDGQVQMVGATRPREVDVRVIAATNKELSKLVRQGSFRDDLFFRLNVVTIDLPPLRERGDDVLLLIRHFTARLSKQAAVSVRRFSDRAIDALRGYHWPGNVRELENLIQRLVVMGESEVIDVADLPSFMRFSAPRGDEINRTLAQVEAEHIRLVLAGVGGNKTRAAEILQIDRKTLREKLKQHGLERPE
jgi:DNA-binding NtrC family response regulator